MIEIERLREYYSQDRVFMTEHAAERFRRRGIMAKDVRIAVQNGEIIEQYPNDFPFPSCLICGKDDQGHVIHICMSDEGSSSRIITAYYPDAGRWSEDFKIRMEESR